jgi:hypothetical protein
MKTMRSIAPAFAVLPVNSSLQDAAMGSRKRSAAYEWLD